MALVGFLDLLPAGLQQLAPAAATFVALWLGWRLWTFTIWPDLHPEAPKPLPYLFPILGHVVAMSKDAGKVYTKGREYFCNTREVFSLTVMGEVMYIVTSPADVQLIYKEPKLAFDPIISDIMADFGCTRDTISKMFSTDGGKPKHWMDSSHDDFKLQLHPGERFECLNAQFLRRIDSWLHWDRIQGFALVPGKLSPTVKTVSLWRWCYTVLVDSATRAMFGDAIFKVAPDMLENFYLFDEEGWKLPFKYPKFAAPVLYRTLDRSVKIFSDYLALPKEQRSDACWITQRLEEGMNDLGIHDPRQGSVMLLVLHRLTNSNAYRFCFWCLTYLLHNESLLEIIREEIQPAFVNGVLKMSHLIDNAPKLAAFYDEMLRLSVDPIAVRVTTTETQLGTKVLQPGRKVLAPFRQMHFNPEVFGEDAAAFNPTRFTDNPKLERSTSWRPFGGGKTHCPGRFITRREVYMFVAIVLFRFDVRLASGPGGGRQKFPVMDTTIPLGGIYAPRSGDDTILEVRPLRQ